MQMPFGKYRGLDIGDIPSEYLEWLLDNIEDLRPRLRDAIEAELGVRSGTRSHAHSNGFGGTTSTGAAGMILVDKCHVPMVIEIVEAGYRALARKYHPDAGGDTEKMLAANSAVEAIRKQLKGL